MIQDLTLLDFTHLYYAIKDIRSALNIKSHILIHGYSGCGKSTLVRLLLKESNFEILEINSINYDNLSNVKNRLMCFSKTNTISHFVHGYPKIVCIDDLDVLIHIDRNFLSFLIDYTKSNQCSVICINNRSVNKKILDVKDSFKTVVSIKRLTYKQCFQIVIRNIPEHLEVDYNKLSMLITENNNDLRTVMNHLDEIHIKYKTNKNETNNFRKKPTFLELNVEEIINEMCKTYLTDEEIYEIITHDINQIICVLHENINKWLSTRKVSKKEINFLKSFNEIVINSEYIGKYIFDKYDFVIWDHYTFSKIKNLNHLLCTYFKSFDTISLFENLEHSQLINKQSLALNFNKKLVKMERNLCVNKLDCCSIFFYIHNIIYSHNDKNVILNIVSKNEFEIITRYLSDFLPKTKQELLRLKTSMLK